MKQHTPKQPVASPGLERIILRWLPNAAFASTVVPILFYLASVALPLVLPGYGAEKSAMTAAIACIAVTLTLWTALFTLALGCWIVVVMKGPEIRADSYPLPDSDEPPDEE